MTAPVQSADGWIEWAGGECPIADDAIIQVQFRCEGREKAAKDAPETAGPYRWSHKNWAADIIAYRVIEP